MYWPIGIPNCYSPSRLAAQHRKVAHPRVTYRSGDKREGERAEDNDLNGPGNGDQAGTPDLTAAEKTLDLKVSRGGQLFATVTRSTLRIWQTKPLVLLATAVRTEQSLKAYGDNVGLLIRPDALIIVVQTDDDFLITYSLASDPSAQVFGIQLRAGGSSRRQSREGIRKSGIVGPDYGPGDGSGIRDISIRFRMVIKIDAKIGAAMAQDDELVVATKQPAAVQCIRWAPDKTGNSHNTELLKRLDWYSDSSLVIQMVYDRPMNLHLWTAESGKVYAVQVARKSRRSSTGAQSTYNGFCFHEPVREEERAIHVAVNARFSLVLVACADSVIRVYSVKDILSNIPLSNTIEPPTSRNNCGGIQFLAVSPDGCCVFVGFEHGWSMWSVYGKLGTSSFSADHAPDDSAHHAWLTGMRGGFWIGQGAEMIVLSDMDQICSIGMARSAVTGCFSMSNIHRSLLQSGSSIMVSKDETFGSTSIATRDAQYQTIQYPPCYMSRQWPIRCSVVSPDGKYIAVAGRRGLAHYSTGSGRWKAYEDHYEEDEFMVRGGMCWYQHILVAAVDCDGQYQIRLISREKALSASGAVHVASCQSAVIQMSLADSDSLLVYTQDNILFHYVFEAVGKSIRLLQVGQIGFHGIIRAPTRVRAVSWVLPEEQRVSGDAAQDVTKAAVFLLIDGKLVLLQPSPEEDQELRYDMRVVAHDVEYYLLAREGYTPSVPAKTFVDEKDSTWALGASLADSLWYFNGSAMHVWPDVHDLIASTSSELSTATAQSVSIPIDFYPLTPIISSGTLTGLESEVSIRRDADFAFLRTSPRSHLFIPPILSHYLSRFDEPGALHLSDSYRRLPYFGHALEVLLHDTLDEELDAAPDDVSDSRLASLLPFLSSFPEHLDVLLGCARKTEIRSWATLFRYAPPVADLFEEAMSKGKIKTAGGLLLVLHTFDEEKFTPAMMGRVLSGAAEKGEWEVCRELARFLVGIDGEGKLLNSALKEAGMLTD